MKQLLQRRPLVTTAGVGGGTPIQVLQGYIQTSSHHFVIHTSVEFLLFVCFLTICLSV